MRGYALSSSSDEGVALDPARWEQADIEGGLANE